VLKFSVAPDIWLSCCRGIREGKRESVDDIGDLAFLQKRLLEMKLVLSGNVYSS